MPVSIILAIDMSGLFTSATCHVLFAVRPSDMRTLNSLCPWFWVRITVVHLAVTKEVRVWTAGTRVVLPRLRWRLWQRHDGVDSSTSDSLGQNSGWSCSEVRRTCENWKAVVLCAADDEHIRANGLQKPSFVERILWMRVEAYAVVRLCSVRRIQ